MKNVEGAVPAAGVACPGSLALRCAANDIEVRGARVGARDGGWGRLPFSRRGTCPGKGRYAFHDLVSGLSM